MCPEKMRTKCPWKIREKMSPNKNSQVGYWMKTNKIPVKKLSLEYTVRSLQLSFGKRKLFG